MSYMKNELERIENFTPEHLEAEGRMLDKAYAEYMEQQDFLRGLMNKALDKSIDTSKKLFN